MIHKSRYLFFSEFLAKYMAENFGIDKHPRFMFWVVAMRPNYRGHKQ